MINEVIDDLILNFSKEVDGLSPMSREIFSGIASLEKFTIYDRFLSLDVNNS